jgi:hypothetical protein
MAKLNKQQVEYLAAKAMVTTLDVEYKQVDIDYIKANNIVNADGEVPRAVYAIDDQEVFDKANAETSLITNKSGLWASILEARKSLTASEENLLAFGLALLPSFNAEEKATLEKAAATDYTMRLKIIDLIMKLNTKTVKVGAK